MQQARAWQRLLGDNGINRINAILGTSEACIATHPSDMCVALATLDAKVHVTGPTGERSSRLRISIVCPENAATRHQSAKQRDHHRRGASRPRISPNNYTYLKIRDRLSYAFALVSVAVGMEIDGSTIQQARFALGGVAHKPWRDPNRPKRR